jgi:hypothetical protein
MPELSKAVHQNGPDLQRDLANLIKAMPRLIQGDQGNEFWMELLGLIEAIKSHMPPENQDQVTTRVHQILASCDVSPPAWWTLASLSKTGRV